MIDPRSLFVEAVQISQRLIGPHRRLARIVLVYEDGEQLRLPVPLDLRYPPHPPGPPLDSTGGDGASATPEPAFRHSADYRSCNHRNRVYSLSPAQAAVVKLLHQAHDNGTPDLSGEYLLEQSDSTANRLADLFRDHPAWQTLVVSGGAKGTYRLAD